MIIGDLEYFMGSLPYLSFENTEEARRRVTALLKAYTGEEEDEEVDLLALFDREAAKFLSPRALELLRSLDLDRLHHLSSEHQTSGVLAEFSRYLRGLREEVSALRRRRRAGSAGSGREDNDGLRLSGNPLEEEVQLMKHQWDKLEDLSGGHYVDLDALVVYRLKLMILLRWWGFDAARGFEQFTQYVTTHEVWPRRS